MEQFIIHDIVILVVEALLELYCHLFFKFKFNVQSTQITWTPNNSIVFHSLHSSCYWVLLLLFSTWSALPAHDQQGCLLPWFPVFALHLLFQDHTLSASSLGLADKKKIQDLKAKVSIYTILKTWIKDGFKEMKLKFPGSIDQQLQFN